MHGRGGVGGRRRCVPGVVFVWEGLEFLGWGGGWREACCVGLLSRVFIGLRVRVAAALATPAPVGALSLGLSWRWRYS